MADRISVIVPVHNGQAYLAACVESIWEQNRYGDFETEFELEVIVINDGSTDETAEVLKELQKREEGLKLITMEDLGVSCARNAGLEAASGDYVTFVDADDRLLPGMLAYLLGLARRTGSDITGCGFVPWQREEELADRPHRPGDGEIDESGNAYREVSHAGIDFIEKGILNRDTRCWSKLYLRESIREVRFEEGISIGEDMLFLLAAVCRVPKITLSDFQGYAYFQNPSGAMNREFRESYMDQITCWQMAAERIRSIRPDLADQAAGILMVSVMLTVGKIADLPRKLRKAHGNKVTECRQQVAEALKIPNAYESMDRGYRIKVKLFMWFPGLYLWLYHIRKIAECRKERRS